MEKKPWDAQQEVIKANAAARREAQQWREHVAKVRQTEWAMSKHRSHRFGPTTFAGLCWGACITGALAEVTALTVISAVAGTCWTAVVFSRWKIDNCDICAGRL